jgi:hypothetical protein
MGHAVELARTNQRHPSILDPDFVGWSVGIFRLSLIVRKLFDRIDLTEETQWGFAGFSTPECNFVSTPPSKATSLAQTASFEPLSVQIGYPSGP